LRGNDRSRLCTRLATSAGHTSASVAAADASVGCAMAEKARETSRSSAGEDDAETAIAGDVERIRSPQAAAFNGSDDRRARAEAAAAERSAETRSIDAERAGQAAPGRCRKRLD
jgi:hypothetical protein